MHLFLFGSVGVGFERAVWCCVMSWFLHIMVSKGELVMNDLVSVLYFESPARTSSILFQI